jgi:predicted DNA-binding transcriptional regulator AlpA
MTIATTASSTSAALPNDGEQLLTVKQVAAAFGVTPATIFDWSAEEPDDPDEPSGGFGVAPVTKPSADEVPFPKPVRRGERFTRWKLSEIREFIAALPKAAPKESPRARAKGAA